MAISNHERVGKVLELLKQGLGPFVEREFQSIFQKKARGEMGRYLGEDKINAKRSVLEWDVSILIKIMS